jgi:pentatricopeptide repeat protein
MGYFHLTQDTIHLLFRRLAPDELKQFYALLIQNRNYLNEGMVVEMVHVFAKRGLLDMAVDALRRLYQAGIDFTVPQVERACAALLLRKFRGNSSSTMSDFDLFAIMLNLGLQPNIKFYNILLHNFLQSGDPETAWRIHDMMLDNGIEPSAYTYSHLLNDAKSRMDHSKVKDILNIVESKGIRNPHIITDLLHAISLSPEQNQYEAPNPLLPGDIFQRMFELYCRYFEIGPLAHLIPNSDRIFSIPRASCTEKIYPSKPTLVLMITSYVRGLQSDHSLLEWYDSFRALVAKGHPDITPLVSTSHIYDSVIMRLGKSSHRLSQCFTIVSDMAASFEDSRRNEGDADISRQQDVPAVNVDISTSGMRQVSTLRDIIRKAGNKISQGPWEKTVREVENSEPEPPGHCAPSCWTWSILLKVCMDHSQPLVAEKVLATMRNQGVTPTHVTWGTLITGYSRIQDIAGVIDTIDRYEDDGHIMDEVMINCLRPIHDRGGLIQALEKRQENKAQVQEDDHSLLEDTDWANPQSEESFLKLVLAENDEAVKKFKAMADGRPGAGRSRWMNDPQRAIV